MNTPRYGQRSKIVLFKTLSLFTFFPALLCTACGFEVHVLHLSRRFRSDRATALLSALHIHMIDFGYANNDAVRRYQLQFGENTKTTVDALWKPEFLASVQPYLFPNIENLTHKLYITACDLIEGRLVDTTKLLMWRNGQLKSSSSVSVCIAADPFSSVLLKQSSPDCKNICPNFLSATIVSCITTYKILIKIFFFIKMIFIKSFQKTKHPETSPYEPNQQPQTPLRKEIIVIAHKGLSSPLYENNKYYDEDRLPMTSLVHYEDELHVRSLSWLKGQYQSAGVTLKTYSTRSLSKSFKALQALALLLIKNKIAPRSIHETYTLILYTLAFCRYKSAIDSFSDTDAKIALISYDFLFSKYVALALNTLNIKTISAQERYITYNRLDAKTIIDEFLCANPHSESLIANHPLCSVKRTHSVGFHRSDILKKYITDSKEIRRDYTQIDDNKKICLVLNFHSHEYFHSAGNLHISHVSLIAFYNDIIRLSDSMPDVHFIIRGKDDEWCSYPTFAETVRQIESRKNIEINRQYRVHNISYKLAAISDFCIACYSSMCDEYISCGKPLIVHDYKKFSSHHFSCHATNLHGYPLFAHSYDDLDRMTRRIVESGFLTDQEEYFSFIRSKIGGLSDGHCRERIVNYILSSAQN